MSDPYVFHGTGVLKNKFGFTDEGELARVERRLVLQRTREGVPGGDFDLRHLQDVHRHLFQDIYDWAGKIRTVNTSKGGNLFLPPGRIADAMAYLHGRIVKQHYLRGLPPEGFAESAADIIGDLNFAHPFREGNGRTQLQYLKRLAERAGHRIELGRLDAEGWIDASRAAHDESPASMARQIFAILVPASQRPGSLPG